MYFIGALRTLKKFYNKYVIYVFRLFFGTQYTHAFMLNLNCVFKKNANSNNILKLIRLVSSK